MRSTLRRVGKIGASAVIQAAQGRTCRKTARQKIESYLRANIRVISEQDPLRAR